MLRQEELCHTCEMKEINNTVVCSKKCGVQLYLLAVSDANLAHAFVQALLRLLYLLHLPLHLLLLTLHRTADSLSPAHHFLLLLLLELPKSCQLP